MLGLGGEMKMYPLGDLISCVHACIQVLVCPKARIDNSALNTKPWNQILPYNNQNRVQLLQHKADLSRVRNSKQMKSK